jgi:hypothetical protein
MASEQLMELLREAPPWLASKLDCVTTQTLRAWVAKGKRRGRKDHMGRWSFDMTHHATGKMAKAA